MVILGAVEEARVTVEGVVVKVVTVVVVDTAMGAAAVVVVAREVAVACVAIPGQHPTVETSANVLL